MNELRSSHDVIAEFLWRELFVHTKEKMGARAAGQAAPIREPSRTPDREAADRAGAEIRVTVARAEA